MKEDYVASREEDLIHLESMLQRLFKITIESLETVEETLKNPSLAAENDLSANAMLAEHLKDTIHSEALFFIAKWHPLGRLLLYVESIIKVSYDLFRIVKYAYEIVLTINMTSLSNIDEHVLLAAEHAKEMVIRSFEAFLKRVKEKAKGIEELDAKVDREYRSCLSRIASMDKVPKKDAVSCIILRQIERIADHATYIARQTLRLFE